MDSEGIKWYLDLVSERGHALAMLLDELFALSRRFTVLLDAVAKLEEAFVARRLRLWAGATSEKRTRKPKKVCER